MKTLRVAIVGCGRMGKERARACSQLGAVLTAVYDTDLNRAMEMAQQYPECRALSGDDFVPCRDHDAIFICTPPGQRGEVELAATAAGLPFFVEKPIGISASAVLAVRKALLARPVIHAVGYMNRYRSSVQHARQVISKSHMIGISAYCVGRKYAVPWWLDAQASGGPVNEQATHLLDTCRYLGGEVESIKGILSAASPMLRCAATLIFRNGCSGTILYSCEAQDKQIGFRIIAEEGGLDLTGWDLRLSSNTIDGTIPADEAEDIFLKETSRFLEAVSTGNSQLVECTFEDAFETQLLMDSMLKVPLPAQK
jgi:myo-inositol 2-dehydrogenase / D-chiro-inositol 1-dehydrogenase